MPWGFAIGAAATIGSAVISSDAATSSANTIAGADQNALNASTSIQQQNVAAITANEQPYINAGKASLNTLSGDMGPGGSLSTPFTLADLQTDPGYQFDLQQGNQAVQRAAAAQGTLNSGGTLKSISNYTTGLASNEVQNAYNRYTGTQTQQYNQLAGLVNQGIGATNTVNAATTNQANQVSGFTQNDVIGAGAAGAAGTIGQSNAIGGGLNTLAALNTVGGSGGSAGTGASNLLGGLQSQTAYALNNAGYGNTAYDMLDGT